MPPNKNDLQMRLIPEESLQFVFFSGSKSKKIEAPRLWRIVTKIVEKIFQKETIRTKIVEDSKLFQLKILSTNLRCVLLFPRLQN